MPSLVDYLKHARLGGLSAARRVIGEENHNHVHVISSSPPVVYMWWGRDDRVLHEELRDKPLLVLYLFPWCADPSEFPEIATKVRATLTDFRTHKIVFLCNEEYCVELLQKVDVEALFVNQNAFVNENVFRPKPIAKTHDAVYSASLAPYKRHELAKEIESLIILSYIYAGTSPANYQAMVRKELAHAWWAKDSATDDQKISVESMVDLYNQARVGLCLSAVEGAMFASMEYLLCGLPIVTTRSRGGRDVFWDEDYVLVVDNDPGSVADGVREMIGRNLLPSAIQQSTLRRLCEHRERLRGFLATHGVQLICPWEPGSHGVTSWTNLEKLGRKLCGSVG